MSLSIPMRQNSNTYYLYVFSSGVFYKIGITSHLRKRLCSVNTSSPTIVECVRFYKMDYKRAVNLEGCLHRLFDSKRLRNEITGKPKEWFTLSVEDLNTIELHCNAEVKPLEPINPKLARAFVFARLLKRRYKATEQP